MKLESILSSDFIQHLRIRDILGKYACAELVLPRAGGWAAAATGGPSAGNGARPERGRGGTQEGSCGGFGVCEVGAAGGCRRPCQVRTGRESGVNRVWARRRWGDRWAQAALIEGGEGLTGFVFFH